MTMTSLDLAVNGEVRALVRGQPRPPSLAVFAKLAAANA